MTQQPPDRGDRSDRHAESDRSGPVADPAARLCAIFASVLQVPSIGVDDDFFDLGGQSLHAMLIAGRIKTELGAAISLMDLFDHPTVGALLDKLGERA